MDQSTQRLDDLPAWRTECLRCHTRMLEMDAYSQYRLYIQKPVPVPTSSRNDTGWLRALLCPNCGCTELFTPDLAQLLES